MKETLLLKTHSFVDVITNSSTELFVGESSKSVDFIKEMLLEYLQLHFKYNPDTNDYYGWDGTIDSICTVEIIDKENVGDWSDEILGWSVPYWFETEDRKQDYFNFVPENKDNKWDEYEKADNEWKEKNSDEVKKGLMGCIAIQGHGDNQIPNELFESIERVLDKCSHRIHQG